MPPGPRSGDNHANEGIELRANDESTHYYVSRDPEWKVDKIIPRNCPTLWTPKAERVKKARELGAMISREQMDSYEKNGFIVLPNVFSKEEVEFLRQSARDLRKDMVAADPDKTNPRVITEPKSNTVRSLFEVHKRKDTVFHGLAMEERLLPIIKLFLGDDVYVHQSRINFQPPFVGTGFGWHSDFETWHIEDGMPKPRALSASILLTDNFPINGPLMVVPESQEAFVGCVGQTPDKAWETSLKNALYFGTPSHDSVQKYAEKHGVHQCTGPAGSVILFDSNLLHGSASNLTPFPRENAFYAYTACSNAIEDAVYSAKGRPEYLSTRDPEWRGIPLVPKSLDELRSVVGEANTNKPY